jgi:SagB-type dehydrogenase family enzyme
MILRKIDGDIGIKEVVLRKETFIKLNFFNFSLQTRIFVNLQDNQNPHTPDTWKYIQYKEYLRNELYSIDDNIKANSKTKTLVSIIKDRRSSKPSVIKKIDSESIMFLIKNSLGVIDRKEERRAYPSAGKRYPLETYVLKIDGSRKWFDILHFNVKRSYFEIIESRVNIIDLKSMFTEAWILNSSFIVFLTAQYMRGYIKYRDLAYKAALIEAGHAAQNLLLLSESIDMSGCPIFSWIEDRVDQKLQIDGYYESVIYGIVISKKDKVLK